MLQLFNDSLARRAERSFFMLSQYAFKAGKNIRVETLKTSQTTVQRITRRGVTPNTFVNLFPPTLHKPCRTIIHDRPGYRCAGLRRWVRLDLSGVGFWGIQFKANCCLWSDVARVLDLASSITPITFVNNNFIHKARRPEACYALIATAVVCGGHGSRSCSFLYRRELMS